MPAGTYYVLADAKLLLDIPTATTKYDTRLDELGEIANREVDDILYRHAATLPLTDDQATSAAKVANYYTAYNFKLTQNAPADLIKLWKAEYQDALKALSDKLDAQPSTNTQSLSVSYSKDFRSEPLASRS